MASNAILVVPLSGDTVDATATYTSVTAAASSMLTVQRDAATPANDPVVLTLAGVAATAGLTILVQNGATVTITSPLSITANSAFIVGTGGILDLPGNISPSVSDSIQFTGANGTLGIKQVTVNTAVASTITGYNASDTIDFMGIAAATSATYLNGTITLLNGSTSVATLAVTGTAANATLNIQADGTGGYYVGDNVGTVTQRLSGSSGQYTIAADNPNQGYVVDNQPARDGNNVPANGSTIGFSDGIGFIDPSGTSEQITRLYLALLGRTPDQGGLTAMSNLVNVQSATITNIADFMTNSGEMLAKFGTLSNAAFINQLYTNVGASPDSNASALVQSLNSGVDRGQVAITFSNQMPAIQATLPYSGDAAESSVYRLYHTALNRAPDAGGLTAFVNQTTMNETQLANVFATSAEFLNDFSGLSNSQLVGKLYQNAFSRAPDTSGGTFWTNQLNAGASRGSVVQALADSLESRIDTASATHDGWVMLTKS